MPHRILICDKEPHVTRLLSLKLSHAGYDVHTATDGEAAWRLMQDWVPDLVIADEVLPRLPGRELIARMRRSPAFDHLPVVLLSDDDHCDIADRAGAEQLHVAEQVHKPFSPRRLIADVQHILEQACPRHLAAVPA